MTLASWWCVHAANEERREPALGESRPAPRRLPGRGPPLGIVAAQHLPGSPSAARGGTRSRAGARVQGRAMRPRPAVPLATIKWAVSGGLKGVEMIAVAP